MTGSRYLDLLKATLSDTVFSPEPVRGSPHYQADFVRHYFASSRALTCLPRRRLDHLEGCIRTIHAEGIEGDLLEAGVWRGGAVALMRATLLELGLDDRVVWAADSFQGLPDVDAARFPREAHALASDVMQQDLRRLRAGLDEVLVGLRRLDLLDENVRFLTGWFRESLAHVPIDALALLHVDCDLHDSTTEVLTGLYPLVTAGGFVVVDDYGENSWTHCAEAVDRFRTEHEIHEPLVAVDTECVYWRKR